MAINTSLLISAAMLQDYIVDKVLGTPLAAGIISMYQDSARTVYKNWYYQTGTPGAYTWIPLDNPLTLSSVGTIQDPNGNDVIPFYYPYDENNENTPQPYYVTVYSSDSNGLPALLQFTRENFPFNGTATTPSNTVPTLRNYIVNNVYWRNVGSVNATNLVNTIIAPSQHDGFIDPDIRFIKSTTGATDNIVFTPITVPLTNDITPEYSLDFTCTALQAGETQKCIQYPISLHVKTLQNVQGCVVIQAQNVSGNVNNTLGLYINQFLGTGALSQPDPILIQEIVLNDTMQEFVIPFIFPDASTLSLGTGGDDALYLQVQYPLSVTCAINHTKPRIYLSTTPPNNDFDTYDEINAIVSSSRAGDTKTSFQIVPTLGWLVMNDTSIGNPASGATYANINAWLLFATLYVGCSNSDAPVSGGRTSPGNTIAAAYTDWALNKTLTMPLMLGRALASAGAGSGLTSRSLGDAVGGETNTLSIANMPAHTHPGSILPGFQSTSVFNTTSSGTALGAGGNTGLTIASQGSGTAFGIIQPTSFQNVFIKL